MPVVRVREELEDMDVSMPLSAIYDTLVPFIYIDQPVPYCEYE